MCLQLSIMSYTANFINSNLTLILFGADMQVHSMALSEKLLIQIHDLGTRRRRTITIDVMNLIILRYVLAPILSVYLASLMKVTRWTQPTTEKLL